jgi:GAF domain-containing protein
VRLADASRIVASSLDYDETLRMVARLPIPRLADWSMLYIPHDGDALVGRLVVAHPRAMAQRQLDRIWRREPLELPNRHPLADCLRKRSPLALSDCSGMLESFIWSATDADILQRVGLRSIIAVPLVAHGVLLGGIMLVGARSSRRPYTDEDLERVVELAAGYAQAIYNAQLFWEASLAILVRDELINAVTQALLELVTAIRIRSATLERASLVADPRVARRRVARAAFEIERVVGQMRRLIVDLRAISELGGWL